MTRGNVAASGPNGADVSTEPRGVTRTARVLYGRKVDLLDISEGIDKPKTRHPHSDGAR
jgi:hypothetical protein